MNTCESSTAQTGRPAAGGEKGRRRRRKVVGQGRRRKYCTDRVSLATVATLFNGINGCLDMMENRVAVGMRLPMYGGVVMAFIKVLFATGHVDTPKTHQRPFLY